MKSIIQKGIYEKGTTKLYIDNMKKGATVLDIEAYCGYYSIIASRLVGNEGKVFAFDPHPDNYKLLTRTVSFNKLNNVVPINKAVSDKTGRAKLFLDTAGRIQ
ncbi:MAG: FkbM family methyltransferase [Candidatus Bathyarchaeia archaeon]